MTITTDYFNLALFLLNLFFLGWNIRGTVDKKDQEKGGTK